MHVSKGYPNMHNLGGFQKLGVKILDFWIFLLFFFLHNSSKKCKKWHFLKIPNFDSLFFHPLNYRYFESPCCTVTLYQISWNFVKGCRRARGHKAEKQNWPLRGQFWPLGVETYMAHVPYQDARTLQVLGLCDPLPSKIFSNALSARTRHWFMTSHLCDQSDRRN